VELASRFQHFLVKGVRIQRNSVEHYHREHERLLYGVQEASGLLQSQLFYKLSGVHSVCEQCN
jgi:hypothetical protein